MLLEGEGPILKKEFDYNDVEDVNVCVGNDEGEERVKQRLKSFSKFYRLDDMFVQD